MSFDGWMEKQMMAHVRIPSSNKQQQTIDSLSDLADSQMLQTQWKKTVSKSLHAKTDSIYATFWRG